MTKTVAIFIVWDLELVGKKWERNRECFLKYLAGEGTAYLEAAQEN